MDGPADDLDTEEIAATEAFAILGNQTRMDVLQVLWESGEPQSFADLREAVAPDDHAIRYESDSGTVELADEGERLLRCLDAMERELGGRN